jgi:hypothetical protein
VLRTDGGVESVRRMEALAGRGVRDLIPPFATFFFVILWFTFAFKGPLERIPKKIQSHVKITVKYHRDKNIPECCGIPKRMIQKGTKK